MSDQVTIGFPLSPGVQARLANDIAEAANQGESRIIAVWCPSTGFFLACHVAEGQPAYWECCGPITEAQADEVAEGLQEKSASCRVLM